MRSTPVALVFGASLAALIACGSRTGLLIEGLTVEDAGPPARVPEGCTDAGPTSIFVVTQSSTLYRFEPPTGAFSVVGVVACPDASRPFSMAVSSSGTAYVVFQDGRLFVVSTVDATCRPTPFASGQNGFAMTFGMAFASNAPAAGETLFVAGDEPGELATVDTTTFALSVVGPAPAAAELTGTPLGALYAFFAPGGTGEEPPTEIAPLDKESGALGAGFTLDNLALNDNWAFAFWGGAFYTFTGVEGAPGTTVVHRFDPTTSQLDAVAELDDAVVGAGASTCVPGTP
jgi:hypothetical protein